MRALVCALPKIAEAPRDLAARTDALYGAWLCGTVFGTVGMALHHKLCHTLGGPFDLPHAETHAVTRGRPDVLQVADRWHLIGNASASFLEGVCRLTAAIRRAIGTTVIDPELLARAERIQYDGYLQREQANVAITRLAKNGTTIKAIVRRTGCSRKMVRQILRGERSDVFRRRTSSLEPWLGQLNREWSAGCRNGGELWRRLQAQGFSGSLRIVGECATRRRRSERALAGDLGRTPSVRGLARLMMSGRTRLAKAEAILVAAVESALPSLAKARELVERFQRMVSSGKGEELADWINDALASPLGFVRHRHPC